MAKGRYKVNQCMGSTKKLRKAIIEEVFDNDKFNLVSVFGGGFFQEPLPWVGERRENIVRYMVRVVTLVLCCLASRGADGCRDR